VSPSSMVDVMTYMAICIYIQRCIRNSVSCCWHKSLG